MEHTLTENQWDELDRLRMTTASADVFRNCTIVLMSAAGRSKASIAKDLGCCTDTVARVRRLYRQSGAKVLHPVKPPGRPSRASPEFINQMKQAVQTNPLIFGYGFSTWSVARLAKHLAKYTGIRFSDDQLQRLLHQEGFSIHRPKHTLKGKRDEKAYRKAKKDLIGLKKKAMKEHAEEAFVFQDEMEIHLHPPLTRIWALVGQQSEIPSPGKNEKRVVYGGVDYKSGKIIYTVAKTKSGQNFLAFLIALVTAYAGRKVRLVCDNGRFHQTKAVLGWLKTHRDKVEVFWLPPYCPSLNLIERLWGHLKRTVLANVLFATMEDLVVAFRHGVARVNGHRNKMDFIFNHDDVHKKAA